MKKRLLLILLFCFTCNSYAATIYFDLEDSYVVDVGWNTVADYGVGLHVVDAIDSVGNATSVAFNCVGGFAMFNSTGDSGVTVYPVEAGKDSFYLSSSNNYAKILIGGLTAGESYDFMFFGSRASSGPRAVDISIGAESVYLDAAYNTSNVVSINAVVAGASGIVEIEVSVASDSSYGYLGVIEINGQFDDPAAEEPGIFVAPWGADSNPGTKSWPLASFTGAMNKAAEIQSSTGLPDGGLVINFRGGKYFDNVMEIFGVANSGEPGKPIIYQSYPGETARFIGGIELDTAGFTLVTSSDTVWSRLDDAAKGNILKLDLTPYGLSDYGSPTNYPKEISFNEEIMQLGRWPNDLGNMSAMETTVSPVSDTTFTYTGTRPERWTTAPDPWVKGNLSNGYFENIIGITGIDTAAKKITLAENPLGRGVGSNKGWYAFNLLEEIDIPGEYYIDSANDVLYFWPPADITISEVLLSTFGDSGTRMFDINGAGYVTFKDLVFEMSCARVCRVGSSDSIVLDGCTFRNNGGGGMTFTVTTNLMAKNCQFYGLGGPGMGFYDCGDKATLTSANNIIINNYFNGTGRWKNGLGYSPPLQMYSTNCGFTVSHNRFEDTRAMGMLIGGNLHTVSYNRFHHTCYAADDSAAIYGGGGWAGGQGNVFLHNEIYNLGNTELPGDYGNHGTFTIYHDLNGSGNLVKGNICHTMSAGRVYINNGGRDNIYKNNVTARGGIVYYAADWWGSGCSFLDTLLNYNYNVPGSAWYETFPHLLEIPDDCTVPGFSDYDHPLYCEIQSSIDWLCDGFTSGTGIPYYTITSGSLNDTNPKFLDEANGVFALADDSPAYTILGFTRIPWEQIGLLDLLTATRGIPLDASAAQGTMLNLYWAPALEAASHKVYLGTNLSAVTARSVGCYLGEVASANMMGLSLSEGTTYYWSVDELDSSAQPMGSGDAWSFTTSGDPAVEGDLDGDAEVDLKDFAKLAFHWKATGCVAPFSCDQTDIDNSGTVDLEDMLTITENWLYGK